MGQIESRVPPQDLSAEASVLGAMLLERNIITETIDVLRPSSFYDSRNSKVFLAIRNLFNKNEPVDLITVVQELRKSGDIPDALNAVYVADLTTRINSGANIDVHSKILQELAMKRELIRISGDIQNKAFDGASDVFDIYGEADARIGSIIDDNTKGTFVPIETSIKETVEKMYSMKDSEITGVPTGFTSIDRLTGGWQPSELIVIAARPAMGKSAFVITSMFNMARKNIPVGFFTLEMPIFQVMQRLISLQSSIVLDTIKKPINATNQEWNRINDASDVISKLPIYIDETAGINIIELRAKARRLKKQQGIKVLIIDYLQLMSGDGTSKVREQEISMISRSLKGLAKELDIPVIALSQLSRAVETRGGDKRPQLSDLRESGSIEQDADMVSFLYRPDYYGITEDEDGNDITGKGMSIISKNRQGPVEDIYLKFLGPFTKWADDKTNNY